MLLTKRLLCLFSQLCVSANFAGLCSGDNSQLYPVIFLAHGCSPINLYFG